MTGFMRRLFRLLYSTGLRHVYASVDRLRYLKRLGRTKHRDDEWYYSDKDRAQHCGGEVLIRTTFMGAPVLFFCEPRSHVERKIINDGLYAPHILTLMADFFQAGSIVIDIGANVGAYAVPLAKAFPDREIHAFEPHPGALCRLRRNLLLNDLANVVIHECGAGETKGTLTFYAGDAKDVGLSSFVRPHAMECAALQVPVLPLDVVFGETARPVSVIKIDVQGFEAQVLAGARSVVTRCRPPIVLEHEDANFPTQEDARAARERLRCLFSEFGYTAFYMSRYDPNMLFPVDWGGSLNGDVLALPKVVS
jgi:FkbM family methyltransferase